MKATALTRLAVSAAAAGWLMIASPCVAVDSQKMPRNVVLIFADDLGYGDIGAFADIRHRTPRIDSLAQDGTRFTDFYVSQAVCTASRASLMTGCYANRVGLAGALNHTSTTGIEADEVLLPEILRSAGYATGMFGKWHLGLPPHFSPLRHGFDQWLGIPYSNDNSRYHPVLSDSMPPLPLYRSTAATGDRIIQTDPDQSLLTGRLTEAAVSFIDRHHDHSFFLYVPHVMPHVPIFASSDFAGKSDAGLYGDVIEELDWSVGEILEAIDRHAIADQTLVIFCSDNGPFLSYGKHAGSGGPFREGKLTTLEGGVRTPMLMRWPGRIPAGRVCDVPLMTIDLLPTFCGWLGVSLPQRVIDGVDVGDVLLGDDDSAPDRTLAFYSGDELQAIRSGDWKLHLPHDYLTPIDEVRDDGKPAGYGTQQPQSITQSGVRGIASRHGYQVRWMPLALYDLASDPGERRNVAAEHPDVVMRLMDVAEAFRRDLGDSLTGVAGGGRRAVGRSPSPTR